jgi:hypothetical protein
MNEMRTPAPAVAAATTPALLQQVSWGAVIAGAVVALAILTVLNLIGLAVGLYVIDPAGENLRAGAAGTTMGIWWALSALAALFAGGWIAAKLTGNPDRTVSAIHGVAVWAAATLLAVFTAGSAATAAFSGAAGFLGRVGQAAGQTAATSADAMEPAFVFAAEALTSELQRNGVTVEPDQLRREVRAVLDQAVSPAERQELQRLAQSAATSMVQNPQTAEQELRQFFQQGFGAGGVINQQDIDQAVAALSQRLGVPEDQVRATISNWQAQFAGGPGLDQRIAELQAQAARAASETADAIAGAALWTALGLLLALAGAPPARASAPSR